MGGGLLHLVENARSTFQHLHAPNASFTHYKSVHRRYTNFATEPIEITLTGSQNISYDTSVKLSCVIPRHADMLSQLYVLVDIPAIYSGYLASNTQLPSQSYPSVHAGYRFQWIRELGARLIQEVRVSIGGATVQTLRGDWIQLWYELFAPVDVNMEVFNEMTGNTPTFYDPANANGNMGVYPTSTLQSVQNTDPELTSPASTDLNPYLRTASIPARTLYVPLPLWFAQNSGASLPLVALQQHEVQVDITLRPLKDLYTVRQNDQNADHYGNRMAPDITTYPNQAIGTFLSVSPNLSTMKQSASSGQNLGYDHPTSVQDLPNANVRLLGTYVFLDEDEQASFARAPEHKYLVEQVTYQETQLNITTSVPLQMSHPVKLLAFCMQRNDTSQTNDWSNYTNWKTPGGMYPGTSLQAYQPLDNKNIQQAINDDITPPVRTLVGFQNRIPSPMPPILPLLKTNFPENVAELIDEATILYNGVELFSTRKSPYFELLQPLQARLARSRRGVHVYSFALNPRNTRQPSGASDTSRVKQVELYVRTVNTNADNDVMCTLRVFVVQYNVLRLMGGLGGMEFAS